MAKYIIGIDFEPNTINTALVTLGKRVAFNSVVSTAVQAGIDETGKITDPQAVSEALKVIWKTNKYSSKSVALGIGSSQALVRPITIPLMSKSETRAKLPELVADLIPVSVENLILDFYPIEPVEVDGQEQVRGLLLAAPKETIFSLVASVEKAGLTPISIDLNALSLLRFFAGSPDKTRNAVYVFASRSICHLVVTEKGVPSLVRSIPIGSRAQSEDAAEKLSFPEFLASSQVADTITREVTQTVQYFQQTHIDTKLDVVYLVGVSFAEAKFADLLQKSTTIEVQNIFKSAFSHSRQNKESVTDLVGYDEYSTAIALAMTSEVHNGK